MPQNVPNMLPPFYLLVSSVDFKLTLGLPWGIVAGNRSEWEHSEAPVDSSTGTKIRGFEEHTAAFSCRQPGCVSTDRK